MKIIHLSKPTGNEKKRTIDGKQGSERYTQETKGLIYGLAINPDYQNKKTGKPNYSKIAMKLNINMYALRRFLTGEFKPKDQPRADKGKSRKLTKAQEDIAHRFFKKWFTESAEKNVKLALYHVKKETGISIPERRAYKWAKKLQPAHMLRHDYKNFIRKYQYHQRRDLWGDYENFLDLVVSDVWKIDDPFVPEKDRQAIDDELAELKTKNIHKWMKIRSKAATAYALVFMDVKTRYILDVEICPHSVCGADVKKGLFNVINEYGEPKQWLLDNGHEYINEQTIDFLFGIHMGPLGEYILTKGDTDEKKAQLKEEEKMINSEPYHPQSKGMIESFFKTLRMEWATYSISYSPNQVESRKPSEKISSVQPIKSLYDLALSLLQYLEGDYLDRERSVYLSPFLTAAHPTNQARPKRIRDGFTTAYSDYEKKTIDPYILSYHYAEKHKGDYIAGQIRFTDKLSKEIFYYFPKNQEAMDGHLGEKLTFIIDPACRWRCWIYSGDKLLSEATDLRRENGAPLTRDTAATMGKLRRKVISLERKRLAAIEEIEAINPYNHNPQPTRKEIEIPVEQNDNSESELNETKSSNFVDALLDELDLDDDLF